MYGPILGGFIMNPSSTLDQGISVVEVLYVDIFGPAVEGSPTTVAIQPGQSYTIPALTGNVSISAATTGHRFSAITFQPPPGQVTPGVIIGETNQSLQAIIPSYLYQQYANDDDLQAFVDAYNTIAQQYLSWLNDTPLAVYTSPAITGDLLDWIALGLYGVARPALSAGNTQVLGPFDTYHMNEMTFAGRKTVGPAVFTPVNDDFFKRILTWKLFKGDGKVINVRWLKRRILRFLLGGDGSNIDTADTQKISVTFGGNIIIITVVNTIEVNAAEGPFLNAQEFNAMGFNLLSAHTQTQQSITDYQHDNQVNINFLSQKVTALAGSYFNSFMGNAATFNGFRPIAVQHFSPLPNIALFKEAIDQGVLDMPFQLKVVVNIR